MAFGFDKLKAAADIVEIIGRKIPLTKKGTEWVGVCPWHDDSAPSLHVHGGKQLFFCPVCGDKKGDVIDFLLAWGYTYKEAAEFLHGGPLDKPAPVSRPSQAKKQAKPVQWTQLIPQDDAPQPDFKHYKFGKPSRTWTYTTADDYVWGFVCRFDLPEGKEVLPLTWCKNAKGQKAWRWQAFTRPRPLLNLHHIKNTEVVVVVEGEKTAEAVQILLGKEKGVTTWSGGTNATQLTDFTPLYGKIVVLWADNDAVGRKAMRFISEQIRTHVKAIKYVHVPNDLEAYPKGWDGADGNFDADGLREWMRLHMQDYNYPEDIDPTKAQQPAQAEPTEPPPFDVDAPHTPPQIEAKTAQGAPGALTVNPWAVPGSKPDHVDKPAAKAKAGQQPPAEPPKKRKSQFDELDNNFFKVLGFEIDDNGAVYCFFQKRLNCVVRASIGGLTKNFITQLAPHTFWEMILPDGKTENHIQWIIDACGSRLVFSASMIRGRGAWFDDGRAVLHVGNKIFVNGEAVGLGDFRTEYIYPAGERMDFNIGKSLDAKTAAILPRLARRLKWERTVDADLLAGWCVVAIICGALDWRPHIWITGPAGSGKSWVFENIVSRLLGNISLRVQGETTEAGVRQSLGHDARPVIFDESEAEDRKSNDRVQSILALMRGSSTSDGGMTVKGSSGGAARTYKIRSCFAFASIGIPISQQSDRSRITMLTLEKSGLTGEEWEQYVKQVHETIDDDYINQLRNRVINMIPTIKANAKVFAKACAVVLGSQRAGDQAGTLLAGWYALENDGAVEYEVALKMVQAHDWSEEKGHDGTRDETRLFNYLMQQLVKVDADGHHERSIAELLLVSKGKKDHFTEKVADEKLARLGFKISEKKEYIIISASMDPIARMLNNTTWSKNHAKILARIEGARELATQRFGTQTTRAVAIPFTYLE